LLLLNLKQVLLLLLQRRSRIHQRTPTTRKDENQLSDDRIGDMGRLAIFAQVRISQTLGA
jgi:hypothetical protein